MSQVALITDTHYGVRGDNIAFLDSNKKFLDNVFFPELKKRKIRQIVHLGDLVDRRKNVNFNTAVRIHSDFLSKLDEYDMTMHVIAGNHDTYHKNTNKINALEILLEQYRGKKYPSINWFAEAEEYVLGGYEVLLVPWICDDNRERTLKRIKETPAKYCFGHLELVGYQMYKGVINEHGDSKDLFRHFTRVFTGHFHHKSHDGNIDYLGAHGQFTWSDYNDQRGFHIFDFETNQLEFIPNPYEMFLKIGYDDTATQPVFDMATGNALDPSQVPDKYIKVVIRQKSNNSKFDKFMAKIQELRPIDIQILDEAFNTDTDRPNIVLETQDTLTIFKNHIDTLEDMDVPKADLEKLFIRLYQQASEIA